MDPIPSSVVSLFADQGSIPLSLTGDRDRIIARVCAADNQALMDWLIGQYGRQTVLDWIIANPHRIPVCPLRFLVYHYDLDRSLVARGFRPDHGWTGIDIDPEDDYLQTIA
jgi:hypothetical protein